ncbi:type II toxin-antitoxin system PemK/MazF family toxin [Alcaligenaceae bacterium]|nr:type II toxin-antitoxin system PemK/MazF family toxin [Alcaligenaceae bacterium]
MLEFVEAAAAQSEGWQWTVRGDLVTVSLQGDYGKPRPALIIQSSLLAELESVIVCPITSELRNALFRITIEPDLSNGLQALSQVMADKIAATIPRAKIGAATSTAAPVMFLMPMTATATAAFLSPVLTIFSQDVAQQSARRCTA